MSFFLTTKRALIFFRWIMTFLRSPFFSPALILILLSEEEIYHFFLDKNHLLFFFILIFFRISDIVSSPIGIEPYLLVLFKARYLKLRFELSIKGHHSCSVYSNKSIFSKSPPISLQKISLFFPRQKGRREVISITNSDYFHLIWKQGILQIALRGSRLKLFSSCWMKR